MKIEVNLSGIFADEDGNEVHDSIRHDIVSSVSEKLYQKLREHIDEAISNGVRERLNAHLDTLIPQLMDHEFTEVSSWGERKTTYTVRNRLLKALDEMCVFKENSRHSGSYDNNALTNSVKKLVEEKFESFRKEYNKLVDAEFTKQAMQHASSKLREALGIK